MYVIDWHTWAPETPVMASPPISLLREYAPRFTGPDKNVQTGYEMKFNLFSLFLSFLLSSFLQHLLYHEASDHLLA